uniref:Boule1 n=1 Tax=Enchytraeus coronatus TaxID=208440 RepID=A0AAU7VFE7_9ANNE
MDGSLVFSPYNNAMAGGSGTGYLNSMHIPKFGTLVPNRIFVGGIASDTTESELKNFFSSFGNVRDCKIILDRGGLSKSYGFVTFESPEDAEKIIKRSADTLIMRDRKLNIGPAIRKQSMQGERLYGGGDLSPSTSMSACSVGGGMGGAGALMYPNALSYAATLGNGVTLMCTSDGYLIPTQTPQAAMYPSVIYHSPAGYYQSPMAATTPSAAAPPAPQWTTSPQWRYPSIQAPGGSLVASPCGQYLYQIPNSMQSSGGAPIMGSDMLIAQSTAGPSQYQTNANHGSCDDQ